MLKNTVINAGTASVNGKITGLAGCNSVHCPKPCIRKDPKLTCVREDYIPETCKLFIPDEYDPKV